MKHLEFSKMAMALASKIANRAVESAILAEIDAAAEMTEDATLLFAAKVRGQLLEIERASFGVAESGRRDSADTQEAQRAEGPTGKQK